MKIFEREIPKFGDVYRHFKGKKYFIYDGNATNCTNDTDADEKFVVYELFGGNGEMFIRERSEFLSPVDKEKYPDTKQEWRFEKVGE